MRLGPTPPPIWVETSQHQWLPDSPLLLYRTASWRAAQNLVQVHTCLHWILLISRPPSRILSPGPAIDCSGRRGFPTSWKWSSFRYLNINIYCCLSVQVVASMCPLERIWTLVNRKWLPVTVEYSLGWVCCSQHGYSVCSQNVCCICTPSSSPPVTSLHLRLIWFYLLLKYIKILAGVWSAAILHDAGLTVCQLVSWDARILHDPVPCYFNTALATGSCKTA